MGRNAKKVACGIVGLNELNLNQTWSKEDTYRILNYQKMQVNDHFNNLTRGIEN